jgi:hypothetical protein
MKNVCIFTVILLFLTDYLYAEYYVVLGRWNNLQEAQKQADEMNSITVGRTTYILIPTMVVTVRNETGYYSVIAYSTLAEAEEKIKTYDLKTAYVKSINANDVNIAYKSNGDILSDMMAGVQGRRRQEGRTPGNQTQGNQSQNKPQTNSQNRLTNGTYGITGTNIRIYSNSFSWPNGNFRVWVGNLEVNDTGRFNISDDGNRITLNFPSGILLGKRSGVTNVYNINNKESFSNLNEGFAFIDVIPPR